MLLTLICLSHHMQGQGKKGGGGVKLPDTPKCTQMFPFWALPLLVCRVAMMILQLYTLLSHSNQPCPRLLPVAGIFQRNNKEVGTQESTAPSPQTFFQLLCCSPLLLSCFFFSVPDCHQLRPKASWQAFSRTCMATIPVGRGKPANQSAHSNTSCSGCTDRHNERYIVVATSLATR